MLFPNWQVCISLMRPVRLALAAKLTVSCCTAPHAFATCPVCFCVTQFTGKHTFFGKTATMLQAADGIGHLAQILLRIMIVLVSISVMLCVAILIFLIVYGKEEFATALEFVVVVLVASVPIAIEVVCTATLALGSRQLSAHGAIVTRLASIEEMAGMNMVSLHTGSACMRQHGCRSHVVLASGPGLQAPCWLTIMCSLFALYDMRAHGHQAA